MLSKMDQEKNEREHKISMAEMSFTTNLKDIQRLIR